MLNDDNVTRPMSVRSIVLAGGMGLALVGFASADAVPKKYAELWNERVNAGIDARIERYRKADASGRIAFRGFRGIYRLTGTGADGKPCEKTLEVR